jgi:hypothetical protein
MLFQKKSVMQKIEAELVALKSRATLLNTKRATAQAALNSVIVRARTRC